MRTWIKLPITACKNHLYRVGLIPFIFVLCVGLVCTSPIRNLTQITSPAPENGAEINRSLSQTAIAIAGTKGAPHQVESLSASDPIPPTDQQPTQSADSLAPTPTITEILSQAPPDTERELALPGFSQLADFFNDLNSGWPKQK